MGTCDQGAFRNKPGLSRGNPGDPPKSLDERLEERLDAMRKKISSVVEARASSGQGFSLQGVAACFEWSLATKERMLGPEHKTVGETCEKLAQVYMKLGEVEKA